MDGLPVEQGSIAGLLAVLQDIFIIFLQQIDMPVLAVTEHNTHTGTLLCEIIGITLLCKVIVILQIRGEGKVIVLLLGHDLTGSAEFLQDSFILFIQDPACSVCGTEHLIFQSQLCIDIPIQINTTGDRGAALLLHLDRIVPRFQILLLKITIAVKIQRSFPCGSRIIGKDILQVAACHTMNGDLTTERLIAFGNGLRFRRNGDALIRSADLHRNAAVFVIGGFLNLLLTVCQNGCQCIAFLRCDCDMGYHSGHSGLRGRYCIVISILCRDRNGADNTVSIESEILEHIGKIRALLLGIVIPVSVQIHICTVVIIRGDMCRIDIDKAVADGVHIDIQPCHIIPGNKQL